MTFSSFFVVCKKLMNREEHYGRREAPRNVVIVIIRIDRSLHLGGVSISSDCI